jgi:hypothetical protein
MGGTTVGVGGGAGTVGEGGAAGVGGAFGGSGGVPPGGAGGASGSSGCSSTGTGGFVQRPNAGYGASNAESNDVTPAEFWEGGAPTPTLDGGCFCTRRSGPGASPVCPAGLDELASAEIGRPGGVVALTGRQGTWSGLQAVLTIPPNALDRDLAISLRETSIPPPKEFVDWSPVYELGPACVNGSALMKLQLPYSNFGGTSGALALYYAKDGVSPFKPAPFKFTNDGRYLEAEIPQFGLFFVGFPKTGSQLSCP